MTNHSFPNPAFGQQVRKKPMSAFVSHGQVPRIQGHRLGDRESLLANLLRFVTEFHPPIRTASQSAYAPASVPDVEHVALHSASSRSVLTTRRIDGGTSRLGSITSSNPSSRSACKALPISAVSLPRSSSDRKRMLTLANPETIFKVQPLPFRCERISCPRSRTVRTGP